MKNDHLILRMNYKIWIETEDGTPILGEGKCKLLKEIQRTGSLKIAIENLGLSYRKTWNNLNRIEKKIGFHLVEKQRGGKEGGHTALTPQGEKVVEAFDRYYQEVDPLVKDLVGKVVLKFPHAG